MLEIKTVPVTPFAQNARILICSETRDAVLIDPGGDAAELIGALGSSGANLKGIWLTHSHLDHCGGVKGILRSFPVDLLGHPDEQTLRQSVCAISNMYGIGGADMDDCPEPSRYLRGGETVHVGKLRFEVLFTPGHSSGHICFLHRPSKTLIAGDTLFAGSIGRTDLPGGNHAQLLRSIQQQIMTLPDDIQVLSGHGPDTTVGEERRSNPFLRG
jgi:hydroxyacylglutathione hydrolase